MYFYSFIYIFSHSCIYLKINTKKRPEGEYWTFGDDPPAYDIDREKLSGGNGNNKSGGFQYSYHSVFIPLFLFSMFDSEWLWWALLPFLT